MASIERPTRNHLNDLLTHLIWLDSLGEVKPYLDSLTSAKIQHFAAEAKALDAAELKEIGQNKRITLLLCLIYSAQVQARDNLVSMFLKRMRTIHNKAKEELERLRQKHLETTEKLVGVLTNVLQVFVDEPTDTQVIAQVQNIFTPAGGAQQLLNECEAVNAYSGNNYLPLIWRFYKSHRSVFFRLISALKFSSTSEQLKSWLIDIATSVDAGYPDNRTVVINELGEPVLKRTKSSEVSPSVKALETAITERMPERNLIDIIRNVDYWTNFTRHFGPLSGSDPKLERATERYLLTTFTYGCNLGPTQAARHMRGIVTPRELYEC